MRALDFDIIIPVYNEKDNIIGCLNDIEMKVQGSFNVLIVYDFDEDDTLPVIRDVMDGFKFKIYLIKNDIGRGPLNAIKSGILNSFSEALLIVMADLSDDLKIVDAMFLKIMEGYDIVCGSRYMKGGKHIGGPFLKGLMSKTACLSLYFLAKLPTHDATNSFKMYRKSIFNSITIESRKGFEIGLEIVVKAFSRGYKITEIPSTWHDRTAGNSKFKVIEWLPEYMRWYLMGLRRGFIRKYF